MSLSTAQSLSDSNERPFEVSTVGAVAVFAVLSIALIGASLLAARDALRTRSIVARAGATLLIAIRSPAPLLFAALILEQLFPVTPRQRHLSRGFGQDLFWYGADYLRQLIWVPLHLAAMIWLKRQVFGGLHPNLLALIGRVG